MTANQKKHTVLKKWLRRLGWTILGIFMLGIILRLSLKTVFVRNWTKDLIVSTTNRQLNGRLVIDHISGDLWKKFTISGLRLTQQDTVASIDSVQVSYNIWALAVGKLDISKLNIYRPKANLQQEGGSWNIQNLLVASSDTTSSGGNFSFQVDYLNVKDGMVSVHADSLPLEHNFTVKQLRLGSSISRSDKNFKIDLHDLSFAVANTKLKQPLHIETAASATNNKITLEKLLLATGNSLVKSSASFSRSDSTAQFNLAASPISWKDIIHYARSLSLRKNFQVDLSASGNPKQFQLKLAAQADGLESFEIGSRFRWKSSLVLQQINMQADYINPAIFLAETALPRLHNLNAEFKGNIDFQNYQQGSGNMQITADDISQSAYHLDKMVVNGDLNKRSAVLNLEANQQQQHVTAKIKADQIWSERPSVTASLEAKHVNPGFWMQDTTYNGDLTFRARTSGYGWYPNSTSWDYSLNMENSQLMGQPISALSVKGKGSRDAANMNVHLDIRNGSLNLKTDVKHLMSNPSYQYELKSRDFDPVALLGMKNFTTSVNGTLSGKGHGFDPTKMQLQSTIHIDSSIVNDKYIHDFSANFAIQDTVATVNNATLKSTIADGDFSFRMNMLRIYDFDNELSLNLQLKDISALAPLADLDTLAAEGRITGKLSPDKAGDLLFNSNLDLSNVKYNDLFTANKAEGSVDAQIKRSFEYLADVNLNNPTFSGLQIRDMHFMTRGKYVKTKAAGQFEFHFSSPTEGRIEQAGRYSLQEDSIRITTDTLNIVSDFRTLRLQHPFEFSVISDTVRMDTMRVVSKDHSAFLEIGIPIATPNEQRGFIRGRSLNTAVIQNCLFGTSYFKGMLTGQFQIARQDTSLDAKGNLLLSNINLQDAHFDSLTINGKIEDDRMDGTLSVLDQGNKLVQGEADLPFKLGDPQTFPNSFFAEPVNGDLVVRNIDIEQFHSILSRAGITNTKGIFSFKGHLHGLAGVPQFTGKAVLDNAVLSGVPVDSVTAGMDYDHEESRLDLNTSILSLHQKAAQIDARIPLFINMKTFRVDLPQPKDSITVSINTHDFNLAALNDFMNRQTVRQVSGKLNGTVHVMGAVNDLKTEGKLVLDGGAFRFVPAGIRVDNMQSTINFKPNKIMLTDFSARSGKGRMQANGVVAMEELVPGDIDIKVSANNFRIANTSQYNAVIDMNTKAEGTFTSPKITGKLNVISGFLELQNFGEKSVENVQLDSTGDQASDFSIYDSLSLDMDVAFNRRFYIRNKRYLDMQIELDGALDLLKDPGKDLQLFGSINTADGYARPFGKEFKLQEGTVTFSGDPTNPQLSVRTKYEPPQPQQDIVIWYIIEGTVEKPKFKYESQPPMELENIISYTLFGQPFYALNSWKQVVANSGGNTTAADVALDVLLDRVETLATKKLGIDVVKIDNNRSNGENGTSITTGWYLNPKVFFAIQNVISGSTPDTSFELEYMLKRNLKIIIRQGNGIRQGVDLRWNYDY